MITTNTGAKKLESSDNWREIFPNPGTGTAGAHNASVDAQDRIQAEVAPIINGKRCAVGAASGEYVLLRNSTIAGKTDGAYKATKAIPADTDLDSTYLGSPITGGMVNELNGNLTQKLTGSFSGYANRFSVGANNDVAFLSFGNNESPSRNSPMIEFDINPTESNIVIYANTGNGFIAVGRIPFTN